jgi:hypothetical protein
MEENGPWYERIQEALDVPLISLGETSITLWTVTYLLVLLLLVIWGSGLIRRLLVRGLERGGRSKPGWPSR